MTVQVCECLFFISRATSALIVMQSSFTRVELVFGSLLCVDFDVYQRWRQRQRQWQRQKGWRLKSLIITFHHANSGLSCAL